MVKRDVKDRIIWISLDEKAENIDCHSVCCICKKDMPVIWDTVCYHCNRTVCYKHSVDIENKWYCRDCYKSVIRNK
jgi:CRISPR/Cas system CMR-associated protein Cmr1 (group 7 of RAMP superfamily)